MRFSTLSVLVFLVATTARAQGRDAGVPPLSSEACRVLMEHLVLTTVADTLAEDPEVKKMTPREREVTEKLARREALADQKLADLIKKCPTRYDAKAEACLLKAKSTKEIDACSPGPARGR